MLEDVSPTSYVSDKTVSIDPHETGACLYFPFNLTVLTCLYQKQCHNLVWTEKQNKYYTFSQLDFFNTMYAHIFIAPFQSNTFLSYFNKILTTVWRYAAYHSVRYLFISCKPSFFFFFDKEQVHSLDLVNFIFNWSHLFLYPTTLISSWNFSFHQCKQFPAKLNQHVHLGLKNKFRG